MKTDPANIPATAEVIFEDGWGYYAHRLYGGGYGWMTTRDGEVTDDFGTKPDYDRALAEALAAIQRGRAGE